MGILVDYLKKKIGSKPTKDIGISDLVSKVIDTNNAGSILTDWTLREKYDDVREVLQVFINNREYWHHINLSDGDLNPHFTEIRIGGKNYKFYYGIEGKYIPF